MSAFTSELIHNSIKPTDTFNFIPQQDRLSNSIIHHKIPDTNRWVFYKLIRDTSNIGLLEKLNYTDIKRKFLLHYKPNDTIPMRDCFFRINRSNGNVIVFNENNESESFKNLIVFFHIKNCKYLIAHNGQLVDSVNLFPYSEIINRTVFAPELFDDMVFNVKQSLSEVNLYITKNHSDKKIIQINTINHETKQRYYYVSCFNNGNKMKTFYMSIEEYGFYHIYTSKNMDFLMKTNSLTQVFIGYDFIFSCGGNLIPISQLSKFNFPNPSIPTTFKEFISTKEKMELLQFDDNDYNDNCYAMFYFHEEQLILMSRTYKETYFVLVTKTTDGMLQVTNHFDDRIAEYPNIFNLLYNEGCDFILTADGLILYVTDLDSTILSLPLNSL
jgi:hypothetical protein